MKSLITLFLMLSFLPMTTLSQNPISKKTKVYLIPGQGADSRMFKNININEQFEVVLVNWIIPEQEDDLTSFAKKMAAQIDTSENLILIGTSLGGMVITEMCDFLNPEKAIIISSAKSRAELPARYKFMSRVPLNRLIPGLVYKYGSLVAQPIVEPDRKKEKATCIAMLKSKNPKFLKRTADMIINWKRTSYNKNIIHIHGNNDHTLPIGNIKYDHLIEGGSHMMTLTRGKEISEVLNRILLEN